MCVCSVWCVRAPHGCFQQPAGRLAGSGCSTLSLVHWAGGKPAMSPGPACVCNEFLKCHTQRSLKATFYGHFWPQGAHTPDPAPPRPGAQRPAVVGSGRAVRSSHPRGVAPLGGTAGGSTGSAASRPGPWPIYRTLPHGTSPHRRMSSASKAPQAYVRDGVPSRSPGLPGRHVARRAAVPPSPQALPAAPCASPPSMRIRLGRSPQDGTLPGLK